MLLVVVFIHEQSWPRSRRSSQSPWARSSVLCMSWSPRFACAGLRLGTGTARGSGAASNTGGEAQRPGPALETRSEQRKRAPVSLALASTAGSSWVVPHMLLLSPNDPPPYINRAVRACFCSVGHKWGARSL